MTLIRGVDVHPTYQNVTSWAKVYRAGARFSIQKASENKQYPNAYYKGARAAGLLVGAYHWLHPNKSITDQVDMFVDWLRDAGWSSGRDLPPVLDLEDSDGLADTTVRARAHAFLDQVDRRLGLTDPWRKTIVYMNPDWRRRMVDVHEGRVLWLAQWPTAFRNTWPTQDTDKPAGAGIWQFVGGEQTRLRVDGIASPCDLNVALLADLKRMAPDFYGIEEEDMTPEQDKKLDEMHAAITGIGSLREVNAEGERVPHSAGYYLAHADRNSFDVKAILQQKVLPMLNEEQQRDAAEALVLQAIQNVVADRRVDLSDEDVAGMAHAVVRELVGAVAMPEDPAPPRQEVTE